MKKLLLAIILVATVISCASGRYLSVSDPQAGSIAVDVLYHQHPELVNYYEEGVLKITSLREISTTTGIDYRIKYRFVKNYYYDYAARMACLQEFYPELYTLYVNGEIEITSLYKYVDEFGVVRHHVSYRRLYDVYNSYYYPYGGYRYYHHGPTVIIRPRPRVEPAPPRPRPKPNTPPPAPRRDGPNVRPNGGHQPPATRPNNPPRNNNVQPQPRSGGSSSARPSNPPSRSGGATRPSSPPSGGGARRGR